MADTNSTSANPELSQGHWVIDGTGWSFQGILFDTTTERHRNIILDPANVQLFEYTNQWNSLVLTGQLVYRDTERNLGKLFRIPHLLFRAEWAENLAIKKTKKDKDGNDAGDYWVEKPVKKEDHFLHVFLVNKMEIASHDIKTDVTTYRLELVSASWYKLSSVCQYSNYNQKKPEEITKIICRLLVQAVGLDKVATKTFLEAPCRTDLSIYYTTTQGDNYFTAINYLLNRMYMEPSSFDVDNRLRIILWDEKEEKYRMAKLNDDSTCLRVKDNLIQLSRFYEIGQSEVNPYQPGLGGAQDLKPVITSLSKMAYTRFARTFYTRHFWDLNITKDRFVRKVILNEKIQNLFRTPNANPPGAVGYYPNPNITSDKDVPDLQSFLAGKELYLVDEAKWNNRRHMYSDVLNAIANRDSFVLTRNNKVCHQPWQCFQALRRKEEMKDKDVVDTDKLTVDKVDESNESPGKDEEARTEKNDYSDNQFFGPWYTYKTTHSITIGGTDKDSSPKMWERLQLIKPFEVTPVPDKIKK